MTPTFKCLEKDLADQRTEVAIGLVWEDAGLSDSVKAIDKTIGKPLAKLMRAGTFLGKEGETLFYPFPDGAKAKYILLLGLGNQTDAKLNTVRKAGGFFVQAAQRHRFKKAAVALTEFNYTGAYDEDDLQQLAVAFTEGVVMRDYEFDDYLSEKEPFHHVAEVTYMVPRNSRAAIEVGIDRGIVFGDSANYARTLVNHPPNTKTPTYLAERAKELAKDSEGHMTCKVFDRKKCTEMGMGSFLSVAQGTEEEPRFIVLEYRPKEKSANVPTICLVGKAITFDTGGISLKPAAGMESMKYDMGGGAGVLGAMRAISILRPQAHVVGIVPATDNMPSGHALHPSDIVRSSKGKSIEIISTDAEGRLILADGLEYAQQFNPDACIDMATLTGAVVIALGHTHAGVMSNNSNLTKQLIRAGRLTNEKLWELPLDAEYGEQIKSPIADMKNTGGRPAGSITAGMFLQHFVGEMPWAHLDIAGMAWEEKDRAYMGIGATGFGARICTQFVLDFIKPTAD